MYIHINRFLFTGILSFLLVLSLTFVFTAISPPQVLAEEEDLSLEVITNIRIVGNNRIPTSSITYYLELKVNEVFDKKVLREDIKRLYKLDHFENINAQVNKVVGGVEVVLNVREKPSISSVKISGNKHIATEDIAKRVTIKKGMVFKPSLMHKNATRIEKYYRGEGYYFVDVTPSYKETVNGKVAVKFALDEGPKTLISSIKFIGNDHVPEEEFHKYMRTKEEMIGLSWFTDRGVFKESAFIQDLQAIQAVMQNYGYLKAKVKKYDIDADKEQSQINISIYVEEGPVYTVKDVTVKGDEIYSTEELQEILKTKQGERYSRELIGQDIVAITNKYAEKGFAFIDVVPLMKENDEKRTVSVSYEIDRGDRAYIRNINITGNEETRDFVIRRELRFQENEILDTVSLSRSKKRLDDLGYFESVKMNYFKTEDGLMDMDIEVVEKPTNSFSAGVGYNQTESMIFTTNITMKNFLGKGQRLNLALDLSKIRRDVSIGFTEPWFMDRELSLGGNIFNATLDYTSFIIDSMGADVTLGKPIDEDTALSLNYRFENISTSGVDENEVSTFLYNGTSNSSSVTVFLSRNMLDSRSRPTEGYKASGSVQLAGLGGDKYYKLTLSGGHFYPFTQKIIGLVRGSIGYGNSYGGDDFKSYARFIGNGNLLRGYTSQEIGPKDDIGGIIGGTSELYMSLELHYVINDFIRTYIFYDRGNVYGPGPDLSTTAQSYDLAKMRDSIGAGLMLDTPIGPINVNYGFKLSPAPGDSPSQFNFGIGSSF